MLNRRRFITAVLGFVGMLGVLFTPFAKGIRVAFAKAKRIILPKATRMETLIGKDPADLDTRNLDLTPIEAFDTMGTVDHDVDLKTWRLEIDGQVQRPLRISYQQILQMPSIERDVLLICPGVFAFHARWKGISVARLLETAGLEDAVTDIDFSGPEKPYQKTERFPLKDILSDKVFLACGVNGRQLPQKHGFPLRLVAEDYYGWVWVKYLYRITANPS
jgi:sulfoxide reductase catalytic subunit YedY